MPTSSMHWVCKKCGTESAEPQSAITPPHYRWPCPGCGDDLMRQPTGTGGMPIPPTFVRELEEASARRLAQRSGQPATRSSPSSSGDAHAG